MGDIAAPPESVNTATLLVYVLLAVNAVRTLAAIIAKDTLVDSYLKSKNLDPKTASTILRDGAPAYVAISIISLVIFGVIMVVLALQFRRGKNWARIVAAVLAALGTLGGLLSFSQPGPTWYKLLGVLAGLVSLAIIVFLFRPDSNRFFRAIP